MIKLESAHIEEVRGIRNLDINFRKENFAISGPNGSGKSGVIDAIEFALTGQIGRLIGRGTKGLSVAEHGPHVDKIKFPDAAFVEVKVCLPALNKTATIRRKLSAPRKPLITPNEPAVRAALDAVAEHPEITLSRREILRFILVEPAKRSEEIQTILKLEEIGQTRAVLNTAQNKLQTAQKAAENQVRLSREALQRHLQIATFQAADVLDAVNKRRAALALPVIEKLAADTKLDAGLSEGGKAESVNKQSALRDLQALADLMHTLPQFGMQDAADILAGIERLEADSALLEALQRHSLIEKGLDLLDGPDCPLCGHDWESEDKLRQHLRAKLAKSQDAGRLQQSLLRNGSGLLRSAAHIQALLAPAVKIAASQDDASSAQHLSGWTANLEALKGTLTTMDGLLGLRRRLETGWPQLPPELPNALASLTSTVAMKPDQSATLEAQTFLATAQIRLADWREAMRNSKSAEMAASIAKTAYDAYCRAMEEELNALYADVEEDFSTFYRAINEDDEVKFTAKLTPSEGRLDFNVNFYERGLFPPGAYHSEGHQDGMGVCLYLALMKRLFGDDFTLALLDDVVMSVDSGHRYQFCKLLKAHFPNTQFVITTHDRLWAEQMKSAGLVTGKTSLAFNGWTVDTGPLVESNIEVWEEIATALSKGKVEVAAARLRHHLEYASRHLADQLGATPVFRADGNYELGDLLPSILTRMRSLYGKAADVAQSWGNVSAKEAAIEKKRLLSESNAARNVEQWAVNKAVHYNEWANFGRIDFEPVVMAFKDLLDCFRCEACRSWLYITPRGAPEALRCSCSAINMNLKPQK